MTTQARFVADVLRYGGFLNAKNLPWPRQSVSEARRES